MKTVYITGNPLVPQDSLPLRIMNRLKNHFPQIEFTELEPTDDMPDERNLTIIDTILGIEKVTILTDIDKIITEQSVSLHDFDLGFNLKLMKKLGRLDSVKIIGVPAGMREEEAFNEVAIMLKDL
jgi:Ni,Fe-hydrogenase maturation factor